MRLILFTISIIITFGVRAQSESFGYYQHIKTVRANGNVENLNGNAGQFVKRTKIDGPARCYDATSSGLHHLNGQLSYIGMNGGCEVYEGSSYWGNHTTYQFDDGRGYLNVKDSSGNIYVFRKTTPPSGRKRSSYLSEKASPDGWDVYAEWNKIQQNNPTVVNNSGSSTSNGNKRTGNSSSRSSRDCGHCHGSGRVRAHVGVSGYGVSNNKKKCGTCGEWYDPSCDHWHACPYCSR